MEKDSKRDIQSSSEATPKGKIPWARIIEESRGHPSELKFILELMNDDDRRQLLLDFSGMTEGDYLDALKSDLEELIKPQS